MPEGPEIKRAADKVASVLEELRCESITFGLPQLARFQEKLKGHVITRVSPRGKALLIYFDNNYVIYSHNQLYGKWITLLPNQPFQTNRQLRIHITTSVGEARLYSASDIEVLTVDTINEHKFIRKLGPDILDEDVSDNEFEARFHEQKWFKKRLGTLMLDQGFIAGTGNYLRSEILFEQGLHPDKKLGELTHEQRTELARATRLITQRSYATGGLCLTESDTGNLKSLKNDYEYYRFAVFGHEGRACIRCNQEVIKTQVAGRRLYLCAKCQPK